MLLGILGSIGLVLFAVWLVLTARDENKRKTPLIGAVICLLITLAGISSVLNPKPATTSEELGQQYRVGSLTINYEIQKTLNGEGKTQIIITSVNEGSSPFSGTVDVKSYNPDGVFLDMSILHLFNMAPGQKRVSVCWLKLANPPRVTATSSN
ncbi:MAG: hypothetical protein ACM3NT_06205 [Methylocystaceae bacterium]